MYCFHPCQFLGCIGSPDIVEVLDLEYPVTLFQGQPHLTHYSRTGNRPLLILDMSTFFTGGSVNACSTQAEHELIIVSVWEDKIIQPLGRNYRTFDRAVLT